jgi:hypothetical protein
MPADAASTTHTRSGSSPAPGFGSCGPAGTPTPPTTRPATAPNNASPPELDSGNSSATSPGKPSQRSNRCATTSPQPLDLYTSVAWPERSRCPRLPATSPPGPARRAGPDLQVELVEHADSGPLGQATPDRRRPPYGGRGGAGKSGATTCHSSSGTRSSTSVVVVTRNPVIPPQGSETTSRFTLRAALLRSDAWTVRDVLRALQMLPRDAGLLAFEAGPLSSRTIRPPVVAWRARPPAHPAPERARAGPSQRVVTRRSWFSPGVGAQEAADGEEPHRGEDRHQQQREEPGRRSHPADDQGASGWRLARWWRACTRSRAWPGWSAKPRPPKTCSQNGGQRGGRGYK